MADIRKRAGKKGTTYQVRYSNNSTKSGYAFKTFGTLKEARAFHQNLGSLDTFSASSIRSVDQAVDLWLDICGHIGRDGRECVEPQTYVEYRRRALVIKEYRWPKPLQEIAPPDVVHFRNWLLKNKSRDLARRTLSSFHSVMIEMIHQGHINSDPASGICVKSSGRYDSDQREVEIPSDNDMKQIFAAIDRLASRNEFMAKCWTRYKPIIYLATFSGMRPSEIRGLSWQQVFDDHIEVTQRADKTGIIGPVKSKAGKRRIFLPQMVMKMIQEWKETCPDSAEKLVFPTDKGKPIMLTNFQKGAWKPLMREAGLMQTVENPDGQICEATKYTPYALRHYFASKLIEKKKDLKFIQDTMGHSRIEITLNVYGHLLKDREEMRKQTAEELAADFF